jgi:hypothetical protein
MNIETIIKECLVKKGAGIYVKFLPPFIEEILRPKVDKKTQILEAEVKEMITDSVLKRAFKAHTAHVAQEQQKQDNQLPQKGTNANETQQ